MEKETNRVQEDRLKSLFKQMPAVSLSEGFRSQMMQRIEKEAVRKRKRQAWLEYADSFFDNHDCCSRFRVERIGNTRYPMATNRYFFALYLYLYRKYRSFPVVARLSI